MPTASTQSDSGPRLILAHGTWHRASTTWAKLIAGLVKAGYDRTRIVTPSLPSVGAEAATRTWRDDVGVLRSCIEDELARTGAEVVVIAHSYASGVACNSITASMLRESREATGLEGGVVGLGFIAAYNLPTEPPSDDDGAKLYSNKLSREHWIEWWDVAPDEQTFFPKRPAEIFYNDLTDTEEIERLVGDLRPANFPNMQVPVETAWMRVPRLRYLLTEKDNAVPAHVQEQLLGKTQELCGGQIEVDRIGSGHCPMLGGKVNEIVRFVKQTVGSI